MPTFEGLDELNQVLIAIALRFEQQSLKKAAMAGAQLIRDEAAERAPRRTGVLEEEEMITTPGTSSSFSATVHIGPSQLAFYGEFVELGTIHMKAVPFLRPALDAKAEEAAQLAADTLALEFDQFIK